EEAAMNPMMRFTMVVVLVATGVAPAAAREVDSRRWIVSQPAELRDLYLDGELTDGRGNRWSVAIVPGVRPPAGRGRDAFRAARGDLAEWTEEEFWRRRRREFRDGIRFAVDDAAHRLVVEGIERDWRTTGTRVAELTEEKPFGWLAELAWYGSTG